MSSSEVKVIKVLNSSIERVWEAWTSPEKMMRWFSPEGMTNPEISCNLVVGGKYRIVMEGKNMPNPNHNGVMAVGGEFIQIEKPHKLKFTWLWEGSPVDTHTTVVSLSLQSVGQNQTQMTLIHTGFADENMHVEHDKGWISTFRKLDQFLKGGEDKT